MVWGKNATNTLGSSGDALDLTLITAQKFNQILIHEVATGGDIGTQITLNNNGNSVYARRQSGDGGSDYTATSEALWTISGTGVGNVEFHVMYLVSISGEEKLIISFLVDANTAGAGNAPGRKEFIGKFVPSPDADITRIDDNNPAAGSFDTDSNISALGTD